MASGFKMVFLPPQRDTTRQWAEAVAQAVPDATIVVAETEEEALREIPDADATFGNLHPHLLARPSSFGGWRRRRSRRRPATIMTS